MNMRKWIFSLLAMILLLCNLFPNGIATASESEKKATQDQSGTNLIFDSLIQFPDERIKEANTEVRFSKYKPSHYYLEFKAKDSSIYNVGDQISESTYGFIHTFLINGLWQLLLIWDFVVIIGVENGFSLDIVDRFADKTELAIQQFAGFTGGGIGQGGIWGNFLTIIILIAGAWIAYKGLYKRDTTGAWSGILSVLFILMASLAFFSNSGDIMRYLNDISSGISQEVMGVGIDLDLASNEAETSSEQNNQLEMDVSEGENSENSNKSITTYTSESASFAVADKLYDMLIYEPYLMMQYGATSSDPNLLESRVSKILGHKPFSEKRKSAVTEEVNGNPKAGIEPNQMMTSVGTFQRFSLLILLIFSHLILGSLFLVAAGAMLVYQFIFIIFALFAPFALLVALFPAWSNVAMEWFKKFVGYQLLKILIGVLLSLLLTLSQFLYHITPPQDVGYAWTIIMQMVLVIGVMWKRNELIGIVNSSVGKLSAYTDSTKDLSKQLKQYMAMTTVQVRKIKYPRK